MKALGIKFQGRRGSLLGPPPGFAPAWLCQTLALYIIFHSLLKIIRKHLIPRDLLNADSHSKSLRYRSKMEEKYSIFLQQNVSLPCRLYQLNTIMFLTYTNCFAFLRFCGFQVRPQLSQGPPMNFLNAIIYTSVVNQPD